MSTPIGSVLSRTLDARLHQVVNPVVLERFRVGIETFRLSDQLHFFVVVGGASIRRNHGSLKVRMLEVSSRIVYRRLLSSTLARFSLTLGDLAVHDCGSSVSDERGTLSFGATSSHMRLSLCQSSIISVQNCLRRQ